MPMNTSVAIKPPMKWDFQLSSILVKRTLCSCSGEAPRGGMARQVSLIPRQCRLRLGVPFGLDWKWVSTTTSLSDDLQGPGAVRSIVLSPSSNLQGARCAQDVPFSSSQCRLTQDKGWSMWNEPIGPD